MRLKSNQRQSVLYDPSKCVINKVQTTNMFADAWSVLSVAIKEIHKKNTSRLSFEELYRLTPLFSQVNRRNAYTLVIHKFGEQLYQAVKTELSKYLQESRTQHIMPHIIKSSNADIQAHERQLKAISGVFLDHTTCMIMVRDILMYLDRSYIPGTENAPIYDLGLDLFNSQVLQFDSDSVLSSMIQSILWLIQTERQGNEVDKSVLKAAVSVLLNVAANSSERTKSFYKVVFLDTFLKQTSLFYQNEGLKNMIELDSIQYLSSAEARLREEENRVNAYLCPSTIIPVQEILYQELIAVHMAEIITSKQAGISFIILNEKYPEMLKMYSLLSKVDNGLYLMRSTIKDYVIEVGHEISITFGRVATLSRSASDENMTESVENAISHQVDPIKWIDAILSLKIKMDQIIEVSLSKDKLFQNDVNSAFEHIFKEVPSSPEYVSLYIDEHMRKGLKGKTEIEIEAILEHTISLFRFVSDKDIFERYYKQHLAKRLLFFGRNLNEESERSMIAKLRIECGSQFTSKLEGMFTDMKLSEDLSTDFKSKTTVCKFELSVSILTTTSWPMTSYQLDCKFPESLATATDSFVSFYAARHTGRKITWLPNFGTADVKVKFGKIKKEINMNTFAMIILLSCFNESGNAPVSYTFIQETTNIDPPDCKRTLQSLSVAKFKILVKSSKGKEIRDDDSFTFNDAFSCPQNRIKILAISSSSSTTSASGNSAENEAQRSETLARIEEARKHLIEACIVRIMKMRKRLDHTNLVLEVIQQMSQKFQADPSLIKKRIESLIEREYLERDTTDKKWYCYLA